MSRRLAHYEITDEIGRGGMGVVYRAEDTRLHRQVALKVLPPEVAADEGRLARFEREAQAVAALNHPGIVTLYSVEEAEGTRFLTMELVEGRTLDEVIPYDGLEPDRFFDIAVPLADAVSAAHDRGVVHRDLKPRNVMVTEAGKVKVLDFGLAKLQERRGEERATDAPTEPLTGEGRAPGTLSYMSPEQIRGGEVDHRSDVFSLGLILYELCTGRHPFRGDSSADVASAILRDAPRPVTELRSGLPRHLARMIGLALQKDPEHRYQSVKDLRNELEELERERSVPGGESDDDGAAAPRRSRTGWLVAGLLAAALTVLAVVAWRLAAPPPEPAAPHYLEVGGARILPGDPRQGHLAAGLPELVRERLRGLSGLFVLPAGGDPLADLVLNVDGRRLGDRVRISYELRHRPEERELGGRVVEGTSGELFELLDGIARSVGEALRTEAGLEVRYRPSPVPTGSAEALDLYLQGRERLDAAEGPEGIEAAVELFERARELDPEFAAASARLGLALHRRAAASDAPEEHLGAALAACERSAELDAELPEAHLCLGTVRAALDRPLAAIEDYVRAIELDATLTAAYEGIEAAHRVLAHEGEAERDWKRVIDLHPSYWAGYSYLGGFHLRHDELEAAVASYQRALARGSDNAAVYYSLGGALYLLGRWEEAIQALTRSIRVRPNFEAYENLGSTYFILRRFDDAVEALERAAAFEDADYITRGNLGKAYYWAGRREEAEAAFRRAIELCRERLARGPEHPDDQILLAHYLAMAGEDERSLEVLGRALEARPNDAHYFYLAALIRARLGDRRAALEWIEKAAAAGYSMAEIRNTVELDSLRDEPRFRALLEEGRRAAGPGESD